MTENVVVKLQARLTLAQQEYVRIANTPLSCLGDDRELKRCSDDIRFYQELLEDLRYPHPANLIDFA